MGPLRSPFQPRQECLEFLNELRDEDRRAINLDVLDDTRLVCGAQGVDQGQQPPGVGGVVRQEVHHHDVTAWVERLVRPLFLLGNELQEPVLFPQLFIRHEPARAFPPSVAPSAAPGIITAVAGDGAPLTIVPITRG